ncbi:NAD(P)/FAD-dependent oxidoreductase [Nocardia fluminea]|uniref:NAD(P)/FAD-dependent oxidoreductase n=1 Tax=Nocardia fluminea TaxID=134984 RepID=UPI003D0F0839
MMTANRARRYDVAIIGSGIGGSVMAAILARNGVRVAIFEGAGHPRFAIGESTVPETTLGLCILAARYGVPELADVAGFSSVQRNITSSCGVKRNFSWAYHHDGEEFDSSECTQFPALSAPLGPDVHYFRQDIDSWAYQVALSYGADGFNHTQITGVDFADDGVTLSTANRGDFHADFVLDAGGMNSLLGQELDLRVDPPTYQTRTRTLFSHFVDVEPFDRVAAPASEHKMPQPFNQGTLHHLFKGGWVWVIPFDNHPHSTNKLCSIGITIDIDQYPIDEDLSPTEEFWKHVNRFPTFARQMRDAQSVRPIIRTNRVQFQSRQVVGDRWALLPHASDFIDPLTSSGLSITMMAINSMADRLISASHDGDYSAARFKYVERWIKKSFEYYDKLVGYAYVSFDSFELWNAWFRVWTLNTLYGSNGLMEVLFAHDNTGDPEVFNRLEMAPFRGLQGQDNEKSAQMFATACAAMEDYKQKEITTQVACDRIFKALSDSELVPPTWKLLDPAERSPAPSLTTFPMVKVLFWGRFRSPDHVRGQYMTTGLAAVLKRAGTYYRNELRLGGSHAYIATRDLFTVRNRDWRKARPAAFRRSR